MCMSDGHEDLDAERNYDEPVLGKTVQEKEQMSETNSSVSGVANLSGVKINFNDDNYFQAPEGMKFNGDVNIRMPSTVDEYIPFRVPKLFNPQLSIIAPEVGKSYHISRVNNIHAHYNCEVIKILAVTDTNVFYENIYGKEELIIKQHFTFLPVKTPNEKVFDEAMHLIGNSNVPMSIETIVKLMTEKHKYRRITDGFLESIHCELNGIEKSCYCTEPENQVNLHLSKIHAMLDSLA